MRVIYLDTGKGFPGAWDYCKFPGNTLGHGHFSGMGSLTDDTCQGMGRSSEFCGIASSVGCLAIDVLGVGER